MSNAKYSVTKKDANAICLKFIQEGKHTPSFEDIEFELRRLRYENPIRCVAEFLTVASRELEFHQFVAGVATRLAGQYRDIRGNVKTLVGTLDNLRDNCGAHNE